MCVDHGGSQAGRKLRDSLAERPPDQVGSWPGEAPAEPARPWWGCDQSLALTHAISSR